MNESSNSNIVQQAGDVTINDVIITTAIGLTQSILPQVEKIEIYESIFSPFITGKVFVRDSHDLTSLFPLIGEEQITISAITPGLPDKDGYTGTYAIYKMDDKAQVATKATAFVLYFMSLEAVTDLNHRISKVFSGEIHKIVETLLKGDVGLKTIKDCTVEETKNKTKYISNFWSPVKNLKYVAEQALNNNDSASYVFFENKYGLNFVSLESLYGVDNLGVEIFRWDNYTAEINPSGGSRRSAPRDYQRILEFQAQKPFDYIDRLKSGMYGTEIIYFDMLTKQYVHTNHIPNWQENENHLNPYPVWSSNVRVRPKSVLIHDRQCYNNFDGYGSEPSSTKTVQKRMSTMAMAEAHKCEMTVYGKTSYSAGQKIFLEMPKKRQTAAESAADQIDLITSGFYLISSICHTIDRQEHTCTMEIIKDSYLVNLDDPI